MFMLMSRYMSPQLSEHPRACRCTIPCPNTKPQSDMQLCATGERRKHGAAPPAKAATVSAQVPCHAPSTYSALPSIIYIRCPANIMRAAIHHLQKARGPPPSIQKCPAIHHLHKAPCRPHYKQALQRACVRACVRACTLSSFVRAGVHACVRVCVAACLLRALLHACVHACKRALVRWYVVVLVHGCVHVCARM